MRKLIDIPLSAIYLLFFGLMLLIFHPIQWIAFNFFGQKAHQKSVEALNFFLVHGIYFTGSSVVFEKQMPLPEGQPYIFIANHQSMFDIPGMIWYLRKYTPLFVSKKELAKGIPSISYNLRVGKAALIDRADGKSAILEIARLAKYAQDNNFSVAIFPEGTRSRTGQLKNFQVGGVATLLKRCPNATIVPIAIQNMSTFNPKGLFPLRAFTPIKFTALAPIDLTNKTIEEVVEESKNAIAEKLGQKI